MPASSASSVVRFGSFEFDVLSGELRRSGMRVNLQDQPLRVLECLLERPGQLVSREDLRRRLWSGDTFVDFEQGLNAAVKRLRETLADSAESPRFIETVPRRGYRFVAPVGRDVPDADAPRNSEPEKPSDGAASRSSAGRLRSVALISGTAIVAIMVATMTAWLRRTGPALPSPELVPLTTLSGSEQSPTFSPDGSRVAFAWDGERQDNFDIYVKLVGSSEVRRLTVDPAPDFAPQWSPDGESIAFVRSESRTSHHIRLMSSLGGSERALNRFPLRPPATWSPDGRFLVAGKASEDGETDQSTGIYLIPIDNGEPRALTDAEAPSNDGWPAISPNGRHLAYASCHELVYQGDCDVMLLDLDSTLTPVGPARRLTPERFWRIRGLSWTRDGQSIVFAGGLRSVFVQLWRAGIDGGHPPVRLEDAGPIAEAPVLAPSTGGLAFSRTADDEDLFLVAPGGEGHPIARSTTKETDAQFSPDGKRIAFCSARTGNSVEIWVADADGTAPERLTRGPGRWQCSPAWSPDGSRIAFDSQSVDGSWHVWTIESTGGIPRLLTTGPGDQFRPTWSVDGKWIYFIRRLGRETEVWRTSDAANSPAELVAHGGATRAWESADRTGIFFQRTQSDSPLYFQPLTGGAPRVAISCITNSRFSIGAGGVYYVPCYTPGASQRDAPVDVMDPKTGVVQRFATLTDVFVPAWGRRLGTFTVALDGRIVYSKLVSGGADLMLIENFR